LETLLSSLPEKNPTLGVTHRDGRGGAGWHQQCSETERARLAERVPGMPLAFISPPIGVIFISFLVEGKAGGHHHSFSSWRRSASD
jgi:hypothetical protein